MYTIISNSGQRIDINPTSVCPLGPSDIRNLEIDKTSTVPLKLLSNIAYVNGEKKIGNISVDTNMVFDKPTSIYALVQGGWLPLPFAIPARFLVDRNVIIILRKIREGIITTNFESFQWWISFLNKSPVAFNPLPFAFEAGFRRKPTLAEFKSAFDDGVSVLLEAIPNCHVVQFENANYKGAYALLESFDRRNEHEVAFLQATCPLVVHRSNRRIGAKILEKIIQTADLYNVKRSSLATIVVLSCLYEDVHGTFSSIGRQILKPKRVYSEADAFNALCDLRHIEIAAASLVYFKQEAFFLCTCDRALALLWSALSPHGKLSSGKTITLEFDLTADLFARLNDSDLLKIKNRLNAN